MFQGEKTFVFWLGLIILGLASIALFSISYYTIVFASPYLDNRFLVPPILGTVVFILIGLYMMKSGTKKGEGKKVQLQRPWTFWVGLAIVASASMVLFSTLWTAIYIYPLLNDPRFIAQMAVGTGMQPRSILNGHDWAFFQAYSWLSYSGSSYPIAGHFWFLSDYWISLVPSIIGALIFILIGLYMMKSGTKKKEKHKLLTQ